MKDFIIPNWPAPKHIKAYTTVKKDGISLLPKTDDKEKLIASRLLLRDLLQLPNEPIWIKQIHSNIACEAKEENIEKEADATYTNQPNQICVVLTADCLPILLCDREGKNIAALHGGWRGLASGIIESTVNAMQIDAKNMMAWIGPCISAKHYEVGNEVRDAFLKNLPDAEMGFTPSENEGKWMADLTKIAKLRLQKQGIHAIYGGEHCTFSSPEFFHSYRRDKVLKGHLATLIWIEKNN